MTVGNKNRHRLRTISNDNQVIRFNYSVLYILSTPFDYITLLERSYSSKSMRAKDAGLVLTLWSSPNLP